MPYYHFIAIGGAGMSGIARILLEQGYRVSGSDIKDSETLRKLEGMGARVAVGHAAVNIPKEADTVVTSSAIHEDNPEVLEARRRGLSILHRADVLASILERGKGIAVAGAHGKTTTTSMIALVLEKAGVDPTVLIGGELSDFGGNAKMGHGEYTVAEADESDGSFLKFHPYMGVITNVDNDHLDYYGSIEHVKEAFSQFVSNISPGGYIVYCGDDANSRESIAASKERKATLWSYGMDAESDAAVTDVELLKWGTRFTPVIKGKPYPEVTLRVPGKHNVLDAMASISVAAILGLPPDSVCEALAGFKGAQRRLQLVGEASGVTVLDDYAHHPTEVKASLSAIRRHVNGRLICIYQPHRFSRTQALKDDFGGAFGDCDDLYLAPVYAGPGEKPVGGITSAILKDSIARVTGKEAFYCESWDEILERAVSTVHSGDAIVTMGAGDIYLLSEQILKRLKVC
jgi:UDP-N-acetylmuramate--alanine ligase